MELIWDGLREAARLWAQGDAEVIEITLRTLAISAAATALALAAGVPLGALLALRRFPGRGLLVAAVNTGMGMPPVAVGLLIVLLLWRSGPPGRAEFDLHALRDGDCAVRARPAAGGGLFADLDSGAAGEAAGPDARIGRPTACSCSG